MHYDDDSIKVLEGLEAVRLRPGMYVGGTDVRALHHLVYEIVDNAVDEALAGRCDHIVVTLYDDDLVSVADNGVGIPVGMNKKLNKPNLEVVFTVLHAGGKFDNNAYKVSGGLHGVGASAVNALSETLTAQVYRDGKLWEQTYSRGAKTTEVTPVRPLEPGEGTGTVITFRPDFTIMEPNHFDFTTLEKRFREIAFINRSLMISLRDERARPFPRELTFYFEGGLHSYVRWENRSKQALHPVVHLEKEVELTPDGKAPYSVSVEVAFQYTDSASSNEIAFANVINTTDGGTHLTGLRSAITGVINRYARKAGYLKDKDANFSGRDTLEGITAVVSVKLPNPAFESQTKVKLINPELQGVVSSVVTEGFGEFLEVNSREAKRIVEKCMTSMRAWEAARKARDLVRSGPSLLESTSLPGKLADCSQHGEGAEIYLVEGDSAGGSAKQARDRHFQAILPLRGKILNTERARLDKMLDNNEIKALISALGTGIGEELDTSKIRYSKIITMTDADVDGAHIRTLLLTFFFRHMPQVILGGHLYIAQPPLFRLQHNKDIRYLYPAAGQHETQILSRGLAEFKDPDRVKVNRYKGLGEMNPDQLWETTMDPGQRTLLQVTIDDAAEADHVFDMLMGSEVPPRRRFIQTHARNVRNLDI
ncbi:MAG: type IIA DNA topoisomerase subunit B [Anaerolineae bacterium]|nr:type IIA DNA topoisomerase subunit B [Anaerolineae bacterium]NUQ02797.1 type IIA DNA topoisomerase subunit B [Anaerolineae bacterium]